MYAPEVRGGTFGELAADVSVNQAALISSHDGVLSLRNKYQTEALTQGSKDGSAATNLT